MRQLWVLAATASALTLTVTVFAQKSDSADVMLGAGLHQEDVAGDCKAAIKIYEKLVQQKDTPRGVAARAQLHIGSCQEKLGQREARAAYEAVLSRYADQADAVTDARTRLTALDGARSADTLTARRLWHGSVIDASSSITPDGRWLAMRDPSSGDIAVRDMSNGQVKRLMMTKAGSPEFGNFPVLSPDLRQVAYEWNDGAIPATYQVRVVANEPGAKPRVLISSRGPLPSAWSPDGKSILALVFKDREGELAWVSAADGAVKVVKSLGWRLERVDGFGASAYFRPSLSPDGRFIAYAAFDRQDLSESSIYVIGADGSGDIALVKTGGLNESPVWTPDGKHVVFSSNRSGTFGLWSIAVQDGKPAGAPMRVKSDIGRTPAVGITRSGSYYYLNYGEAEEATFITDLDPVTGKIRGAATRLDSSFGGSNPAMAWSPDGKFIASAKRDELVVLSIETGETRSMLKSMRLAGSTMWLRDGKTLLQAVRDSANTIHFDRVDVSTGEFKDVLATGSTTGSLESALSPDEKTIYTNAGTGNTNGSHGITAFDLATGQRRAVFTAKDEGLVPGLALSPDGRTLVFKVFYQGKRKEKHLCLIGVDSSNFREIYTDTEPGDGTLRPQLAWTRNGRSILFTRATEDGWRLMRIPAEGGTPEFTGLAGKGTNTNIVLNPDGSRIAFNDSVSAGNAELWALDNLMSVLKGER